MAQNQDIFLLESLINRLSGRDRRIECFGISGSEKAYLISKVFNQQQVSIFVIVDSLKEGQQVFEDLKFFCGNAEESILFFPPYNILPFKFLSYHNETAAHRISVLHRLMEATTPRVVVTTVDALLQKIVPKEEIIRYVDLILTGEEIDRERFIAKLISGGYTKAAIVEEPGDFSVRGGIVDVYSPLYPDPLRIEFFGDLVESLRFFSVSNQRKIRDIDEAVILPAKEVMLTQSELPQIISRIRAQASKLDLPVGVVRKIVDYLKNSENFPGIESLISLIYPELDTLFDYIPQNSLMVVINPDALKKSATELDERLNHHYTSLRNEKKIYVEPQELYLKWSEAETVINKKKPLVFKMLDVFKPKEYQEFPPFLFKATAESNADLSLKLKQPKSKEHLLRPLVEWLAEKKQFGYTTMIVCQTRSQADRLHALLNPYMVDMEIVDGIPPRNTNQQRIYICIGRLSAGFVWPEESLAIITDDEIFGVQHHRRKHLRPKPSASLLDLQELKKDDLIVHNDHGIGQYGGLVKLNIGGITNDFVVIIYKGGDKLYLPVDRMSMAQKYMGVDGVTPVLDALGGKSWERIKARVKKSAEKIAGDLLNLYAHRRLEIGHGFTTPDSYFKEFEAGFSFEETSDQLKAIDDVLGDLQGTAPMDRLVCGDVGYGKTEVALRASFLVVNDGKQVAVLVPTTILAEQHYATFCSRFNRYPVNIACLSRFRPRREQRAIVCDLNAGKIDIVIGTHRLLQKDVIFKDIGLLVLDEEQRFGVRHKEKLKRLRNTVDVLALTATPIPRTLHLSLVGIRDISVISTPPEYRKSIITYICEFDDVVIAESVRKELQRRGQIFFVHNNIQTIDRIAAKLQGLVPEVRLAVAHGRMPEDELEQVMFLFINKEIDMLVCTTIIESGLDIPAANTIIVNRADRFGLAQMYQLRGRVGRADEQAYAYLLIPHESLLGKNAQKRLKVLMEHSDLGSGFQIAMNDLKIRGGGTILGASQSGHIAAVGYDMFLKLMESAMAELKGEPTLEPLEPEVNISFSAFLAETYIVDIDQRMAAYRRLARMNELHEIADFKSELIDRFGPLPEEAANLLLKIALKVLAKKAGVAKLDIAGKELILQFSQLHQSNPAAMIDMILADPDRFELTPEHVLKAKLSSHSINAQLAQAKYLLKDIAQRVND